MSRKKVLINVGGEVWEMTGSQWRDMMAHHAKPETDVEPPSRFGGRTLGIIEHSVLDWSAADWQRELTDFDTEAEIMRGEAIIARAKAKREAAARAADPIVTVTDDRDDP